MNIFPLSSRLVGRQRNRQEGALMLNPCHVAPLYAFASSAFGSQDGSLRLISPWLSSTQSHPSWIDTPDVMSIMPS